MANSTVCQSKWKPIVEPLRAKPKIYRQAKTSNPYSSYAINNINFDFGYNFLFFHTNKAWHFPWIVSAVLSK